MSVAVPGCRFPPRNTLSRSRTAKRIPGRLVSQNGFRPFWHGFRPSRAHRHLVQTTRHSPTPLWDTSPPPLWAADFRLGTPSAAPEQQNAFRDASCPRAAFGHSRTAFGRPGHAATRSGPRGVPARPKAVPERHASRIAESRSGTPHVPNWQNPAPERHASQNGSRCTGSRRVLKWPFLSEHSFTRSERRNPRWHRFCASLKVCPQDYQYQLSSLMPCVDTDQRSQIHSRIETRGRALQLHTNDKDGADVRDGDARRVHRVRCSCPCACRVHPHAFLLSVYGFSVGYINLFSSI